MKWHYYSFNWGCCIAAFNVRAKKVLYSCTMTIKNLFNSILFYWWLMYRTQDLSTFSSIKDAVGSLKPGLFLCKRLNYDFCRDFPCCMLSRYVSLNPFGCFETLIFTFEAFNPLLWRSAGLNVIGSVSGYKTCSWIQLHYITAEISQHSIPI